MIYMFTLSTKVFDIDKHMILFVLFIEIIIPTLDKVGLKSVKISYLSCEIELNYMHDNYEINKFVHFCAKSYMTWEF